MSFCKNCGVAHDRESDVCMDCEQKQEKAKPPVLGADPSPGQGQASPFVTANPYQQYRQAPNPYAAADPYQPQMPPPNPQAMNNLYYAPPPNYYAPRYNRQEILKILGTLSYIFGLVSITIWAALVLTGRIIIMHEWAFWLIFALTMLISIGGLVFGIMKKDRFCYGLNTVAVTLVFFIMLAVVV